MPIAKKKAGPDQTAYSKKKATPTIKDLIKSPRTNRRKKS
jgi:hypothetical protein